QWGAELTGDFDVKFTAQVNLLTAGATLSGFKVYFNIAVYDKPVTVNWTTLNGTQTVSTGSLSFICTPFQSLNIDTVTVVPSVINNDPYFDFRVFNRNDFQIPISRFVTQLQTIGGGTMRPSKITAPAGWQLDSVTALYAYFRTTTSPIAGGDNLSGFKVCLRGNPAVNKFTFNWFTYEEGDALLGRDTIRNISVTFSGSASEADSLSAAVVNGCLYALTVKNYHVSNSQPPSKIRKIVLLSKTPGLIFTAAPSAPVNWSKTVTQDSIVYTASADSSALSSSKVTNLFRFSVDPPNTNPFKVGWRTYKTLSEVLSTGEMQLQCNEQPPLEDNATIDVVDTCNWNIRITNQHNTPASDLYAIELSIPAGSGILTTVA
ncbi:MAG TPA: hypothetical protein VJ508_10635, partial [Saprospiraceae bacterium]|nr:hypothetical protein [Saprospiraceae bacterium]